MSNNPLLKIQDFGQSIWLDFIRRGMLTSGELDQFIEEDGLRGVTSNPAIFEKAIAGSNDYRSAISSLALEGKRPEEIYEILAIEDVRQAADAFRSVFAGLDGRDGFVSLEVSPDLARDTDATIQEARRLWSALDRPNVFIKVPATKEGLPAIRQLISEGINVNVTLLFGLERYRSVTEAYVAGLEARVAAGQPLNHVASVASFFLSRIDLLVDPVLEDIVKKGGPHAEGARFAHGEVAIASAKVAYQIYREVFSGARFRKLADRGARPQRVLWASTSTKNPEYRDVKYVEALIGPETINTLPLETLNAYRDHGDPALRLEDDLDRARNILARLPEVGIDLEEVAQKLEDEGIEKFSKPFHQLLQAMEERAKEALSAPIDQQTLHLGKYEGTIKERQDQLQNAGFSKRLWRKDPGLWAHDAETEEAVAHALGWLHVAEKMVPVVPDLQQFAAEIKDAGFRAVAHMGMGGSSLAPLVFQRLFPVGGHGLPLTVLDTTDPLTILKIEREIPLGETLFVVATKSGTTAEPLAFGDYFYDKVKAVKGHRCGENFIAITDPGTPLVDLARQRNFRRVFLNFEDIGGRYSALSYFGMVPGALMGLDIAELIDRSLRMMHACTSCVPCDQSPGIALGVALGELANRGRDKLTFLTPDSLSTFGMWLEQLIAESTGKEGRGILPVAGEDLAEPDKYGDDRAFVCLQLATERDEAFQHKLAAVREAGHPVITLRLKDLLDLGQEFLRWEIATAAAGAVLGINPFDQPNVQESKNNTNRLLKQLEKDGRLPQEIATASAGPLRIFANQSGADARTLLSEFFDRAHRGDYLALQAYLPEETETDQALQEIRLLLRDRLRLATTVGYGPRYLHSTGQYHKGGPNSGLFLQLTADAVEDAPIPGSSHTFGVLRGAQAAGDLEALRRHNRRILRVDLGGNVLEGLTALREALQAALSG